MRNRPRSLGSIGRAHPASSERNSGRELVTWFERMSSMQRAGLGGRSAAIGGPQRRSGEEDLPAQSMRVFDVRIHF